jgi:hypothetical protein
MTPALMTTMTDVIFTSCERGEPEKFSDACRPQPARRKQLRRVRDSSLNETPQT